MSKNVADLKLALDMIANKHKQVWLDYAKRLLKVEKSDLDLKIDSFFAYNSIGMDIDFVLAYPYLMNDKKENFVLVFKNGYFKDTPMQNKKLRHFGIRVGVKLHKEYERNMSIETVQKIYQKVYDDLQNSFENIQEAILDDFVYRANLTKIEIMKIIEKELKMYNAEVFRSDLRQTDNKKYEFDFNVVFKAVTSNNSDDLEIRNKLNYTFDKDFNGVNVKINLLIHLQKETKYVIDNYHILPIIEIVLKQVENIFKPEIKEVENENAK